MLWSLSVTSVSSMVLGHCSARRHYTLHPHPLHLRQGSYCLGTGTEMVTEKVKGWPWEPTAQPHRGVKCVKWVEGAVHHLTITLASSNMIYSVYYTIAIHFLSRWINNSVICSSWPHRGADLCLCPIQVLWALMMKRAYASWATSIPDSHSSSVWFARPVCAVSAVRYILMYVCESYHSCTD